MKAVKIAAGMSMILLLSGCGSNPNMQKALDQSRAEAEAAWEASIYSKKEARKYKKELEAVKAKLAASQREAEAAWQAAEYSKAQARKLARSK